MISGLAGAGRLMRPAVPLEHAHYFDGIDGNASCVRKTIIEADYGDEAEKIAQAQMGLCERVEASRVATSAPARVIYAARQAVLKIPPLADIFALMGNMSKSRGSCADHSWPQPNPGGRADSTLPKKSLEIPIAFLSPAYHWAPWRERLPSLRLRAPSHQAFIEAIGVGVAWPLTRDGGRLRQVTECFKGRGRYSRILL
jgi:hypothetical protein